MKQPDETKTKPEAAEDETPLPADELAGVSGGYKPCAPLNYSTKPGKETSK